MLRRVLLSTACCFFPTLALAEPLVGPYVSLGAGVNLQQNEDHRKLSSTDVEHQLTFHPGFAGQLSIGYGVGYGLRFEIEGDFIDNVVRSEEKYPLPRRTGGVEEKFGGFVNAIYDFNLALPIQPYLGVGAGAQAVDRLHVNNSSVGFIYPTAEPSQANTAFAYQGIAGFAYPVSFMPGLSFTADYRFIGFGPLGKYRGVHYSSESSPGVSDTSHVTNDFNHIVMLGLRYALFQPASPAPAQIAPPPPVPSVAPSRTYLVFFDWDRADLTARARQIVAEAATASTHIYITRIDINGYTDLSGTAAYNQKLSVRRAQSVEAELMRDGVNSNEISVHGYGESSPLVPTATGVREPQNRRVEIIMQ